MFLTGKYHERYIKRKNIWENTIKSTDSISPVSEHTTCTTHLWVVGSKSLSCISWHIFLLSSVLLFQLIYNPLDQKMLPKSYQYIFAFMKKLWLVPVLCPDFSQKWNWHNEIAYLLWQSCELFWLTIEVKLSCYMLWRHFGGDEV
jgi:hypothetical protein